MLGAYNAGPILSESTNNDEYDMHNGFITIWLTSIITLPMGCASTPQQSHKPTGGRTHKIHHLPNLGEFF